MKAIFFDLFETLITHFDPAWTPPPRTIAERLGVEQQTFINNWKRFDQAWQAGGISDYANALAQTCAACGREPDQKVLMQLAAEYDVMTRRVFEQIEDYIVDMVRALKRSRLKLGVITNAGDLDAAPWSQSRLAPYFDDFVASHQVRLLKSDGRIFELACHRLNVDPDEALFVGDGGGNELLGATEAGIEACWCTWFLDRWPEGIRPNGFPGDDWRQGRLSGAPPYERLASPLELLKKVGAEAD